LEKKLVITEQRDTITAEKLSKEVTMSNMSLKGSALKDEDFLDPFIGMEKATANYNT
jgi:ATP-binding cassette subfamily F protein 3